jgi:hypothetical protein
MQGILPGLSAFRSLTRSAPAPYVLACRRSVNASLLDRSRPLRDSNPCLSRHCVIPSYHGHGLSLTGL